MANEAKHKHLEFIQAIINRMGNNSFNVKSWTIAIVVAIFALAADKEATAKLQLLSVSLIPVFVFWILDGYFIWQERLFREHYKSVSKIEDDNKIDYQMNVKRYNEGRNTWGKSICSKTLNLFYLTLLGLMLLIGIIIMIII